MAVAIASSDLAGKRDGFRLDFNSIGAANPGNAAAIAVGLGVPVSSLLEVVYRAPAVLVDGLEARVGQQMAGLLRDLGCEVDLVASDAPPLPSPQLYDVALHVEDTTRYTEIINALAAFLGAKPDDAARLISTPPGVVLGKVSQATIDALSERLGNGALLAVSDPDQALYDVFLGACDAAVGLRLRGDLQRQGYELLGETGCILSGLSKAQADAIWSAHHRIGELRVINRDFLRFDLVMTGGELTEAAHKALADVAGIPDHIIPMLFDEGDITVVEALAGPEMPAAMEDLAAAGLDIRADLMTFAHLGLEIIAADRPRAVRETLETIGLSIEETALRQLPYRLPYQLPELQARLVRDALHLCGAEANLVDEVAA